MEQVSSLTRSLSDAQIAHHENRVVTFHLYTETKPNLLRLVARYFEGATLFDAVGLWKGQTERSTVVEIIGTIADLQNVTHLAGDIGYVNAQTSVLVTFDGKRLDVPGIPVDNSPALTSKVPYPDYEQENLEHEHLRLSPDARYQD